MSSERIGWSGETLAERGDGQSATAWLLRGVVASHAMPAIVAAPGPQGVNDA